ncbi:DUF5107 domain-containing protein [Tessaracoccus sp.]
MIRQIHLTVPMADLGPDGLPVLDVEQVLSLSPSDRELLGEHAGRPLMDRPVSVLPYRRQNHYGRRLAPQTLPAIEMSNDHLRAVFLPSLGGRLWSLEDRASGRDLLFQPDAIQFGNLALRDAWFSGGIEWNLGMTGHWGLTNAPVGAGIVEVDGQQVLRMWAWERLTRMVWRMDACLPEGSRFLFTSPRIVNAREEPAPFYWWSNAAITMREETRVVVPAPSAVQHSYELELVRVAYPGNPDVTRPSTASRAVDYFFETAPAGAEAHEAPWVAACDDGGPGTILASTTELRGKKLFVWGGTRGGSRWQDWLNGSGRYCELQSGFSRTQQEHVALNPGQMATWVEAFGPVEADPSMDFAEAVHHITAQVPAGQMEEARVLFEQAAPLEPAVWHTGDGWGRVEVEAGFLPVDPSTPFDTAPLDAVHRAWLAVAKGQQPSSLLVRSPQTGAPWEAALEQSAPCWQRDLLLGYVAWSKGERSVAESHWRDSVAGEPHNAMALHALALCSSDGWDSFDFAERAHEADPEDDDLLVDYLSRSVTVPTLVLAVVERLPVARRALPRVMLAEARALVAQGSLAESRDIIDSLVLPDLRELSSDLSDLWSQYTAAAGSDEPLPEHLDFTML